MNVFDTYDFTSVRDLSNNFFIESDEPIKMRTHTYLSTHSV